MTSAVQTLPTSLRERNKSKRRLHIINVARSLFTSHGYSTTRLEDVAEDAEVGVATVYNYFGNKAGLLASILEVEFAQLFESGEGAVAAEHTDPLEHVLALIDVYYKLENEWQSSEMLLNVLGPGLAVTPELDAIAVESERQVKSQLKAILTKHRAVGNIRKDVDIDDATMVLFYIFNQHYIEFITGQWHSFEKMKQTMNRLIGFVISSIGTIQENNAH